MKYLLKKVLFLECIRLNGMSFDQKLLNATSKHYFSTIYLTSTSLQLSHAGNLFFYFCNMFFSSILFCFIFFEPVHLIFLRRVHLILISILEEILLSFYHLYINFNIFNYHNLANICIPFLQP